MDISKHKFIILADGHYNPLGIARSLGRAKIKPDVVLVGNKNGIISKSKYLNSLHIVPSPSEGVDYILDHFSNSESKSFLMTGGDKIISAIDARYNDLFPYFITYNCGKQNGINELLSKAKQNELAQSVGLNVPDYEVVNVGDLPSHVKYPIMTKAVDSTVPNWKGLVYICKNEQDLLEAYSKMQCPQIMLQHYIEKENETGFNGVSVNSGKDVFIPLQLSYFSTFETTFGNSIYLFEPKDNDLCKKVKMLIEKTGYSGAFSIDFLIGKDKKIYFLEINFRNSAWSFPYTCAGVNLPLIWSKSMLAGKIVTDSVKIKKLPFTCIVDLWELSAAMKRSLSEGIRTFWQIIRSDSHIFWDKYDRGPFWAVVKSWISDHILRKRENLL